jgi:hypothetical protein
VLATVSTWLHEGERDAIGIYRNPWIPLTMGLAVMVLSPAAFLSTASAQFAIALVILVLVGFGTVCWLRKAAILTPTAILFRPVVGRPSELSLTGVKRVSRVLVTGSDAGDYEVCRLEFIVGGYLELPWGYLHQSVLIAHLEELVASARAITPM